MQEEGGIHIVERELLDKLLEELKLSSSDLADPELALRVGRIVSAKLIATGSITRYGRDLQVNLRVIETETTAVKATVAERDEGEINIDVLSEKVALGIIGKLKAHYPLRGKIVSLEDNEIILNIGTDQGVTSGVTMSILAEMEPVRLKGKRVVPKGRAIGKIEVTAVEPGLAYAKIIKKNGDIQVGCRVEQLTVQREQWPEGQRPERSERI